ncbi:MAG TPA: hypothetical protein DCZ97_15890 [Syntrophus sp. (in: bacteria)]|nr:hypothetical protein [Syntrophus sp. (in: bacteria)]
MILRSVEEVVGSGVCRAFINATLVSVEQYCGAIQAEIVTLAPEQVHPLSRYAVKSRVERAHKMLDSAFAMGIVPFELMTCEADGDLVRLVFPPVAERHMNGVFLVDGVHRFLAAIAAGLETVKCVCVGGKGIPALPCAPITWGEVVVDEQQREVNEILPGLDMMLFRHLTSLFNSERFKFADLSSLLRCVDNNSRRIPEKGE